jgi:hypothetical protein
MQMQMLAEFGPQNLEQSWAYFKHWVKGRPLSDAVNLPSKQPAGQRSDYGSAMPDRMYEYEANPSDRQPGVRASDPGADSAAIQLPGEDPPLVTSALEDEAIQLAREFRGELETELRDRQKVAEQHDTEDVTLDAIERGETLQVQRERHIDAE